MSVTVSLVCGQLGLVLNCFGLPHTGAIPLSALWCGSLLMSGSTPANTFHNGIGATVVMRAAKHNAASACLQPRCEAAACACLACFAYVAGDEWSPFDFTMSRFLHGSDEERNSMFKLIPHCAKGSWVVSQSVGTTPVILGRKLVSRALVGEQDLQPAG